MKLNGKHELNLPEERQKQWQTWADRGTNWEPERLDSIMDYLADGEDHMVFDIGSERGDFPALWSTAGAKVVLVEPSEKFWPEIRETWNLNNTVPPLGMVVGFCGPERRGPRAPLGTWPAPALGEYHPDPGFYRIVDYPDATVVTIDELTDVFGCPTAISMDIEGAELQALRGGTHTFLEHRCPAVWVSVHPDFMPQFHDKKENLLLFMEQMEYNAELLATDHEEHWMFTPR